MRELTSEHSFKIQMLRGIAIIAVVFIHNAPGGGIQIIVRPFLNFGVGVFLFLSGLLSDLEHWNPIKRIKKVMIPFLIWTFIYVIIGNIHAPAYIPVEFVKRVICADSAPMMYYVFVYLEFTLLIPAIDKISKSKFFYIGFLITPIEMIFMRYIPLITGISVSPVFSKLINVSCIGWFTYFYLGYLIGNDIIKIRYSKMILTISFAIALILQMIEGYIWYSIGETNCGTQLKITAILSGVLFCLIAYGYVKNDKGMKSRTLKLIGDDSFGIFFGHIAVMTAMQQVPYYSQYCVFPLNAVVSVVATLVCVETGKKVLGKNSKYLAL